MSALDFQTLLPNLVPSTFEFGIVTKTLVSTSALTGSAKTIEIPGARWRLRMSFTDLTQEDMRPLMAFLMRLRGAAGRFTYTDITAPITSVTGTLTIGTVHSANEVTIAGATGAFIPGDYISITRSGDAGDVELKMITSVVSANRYTIEPALRSRPLSFYTNKAIVRRTGSVYPKAKFMLTSDDQVYWPSKGKIFLSSIDLEAIEVE